MKQFLLVVLSVSLPITSVAALPETGGNPDWLAACQRHLGQRVYSPTRRQATPIERHNITHGFNLEARVIRDHSIRLNSESPWLDEFEVMVRSDRGGMVTTGYILTVTDGGDESFVSYYVDLGGRILFAKWHNQSPMHWWVCEGFRR